jgi:predicted hydrocarbon binding protein
MKSGRPDRLIPARLFKYLLEAVEEQLGLYSLNLIIHNAGLNNYLDEQIMPEGGEEVWASEYAAFIGAVRQYYGTGARGCLLRAGQQVFRSLLADADILQKVEIAMWKKMPLGRKTHKILDFLASQLRGSDGEVSVYFQDTDIIFVDLTSFSTIRQTAQEPVCWVTLGMLQEALLTVFGVESDIEEISCRAAAAESCTFRIRPAIPVN